MTLVGPENRDTPISILVLEDEQHWSELIITASEAIRCEAGHARNLAEAERAIISRSYDIVIIDRQLAQSGDGLALLDTMKSYEITPMVLVVSQLATVGERVTGLMAGADDYLPKPFDAQELQARIIALARRVGKWANYPTIMLVDQLEIRRVARTVAWKGQSIRLPDQLFDLLCAFADQRGEIVSREYLWREVWSGYQSLEPQNNAIEAAVSRLRRILEETTGRPFITSIRGRGYRFDAD